MGLLCGVGVLGPLGHQGVGVSGCIGGCRECRYSSVRIGIGDMRGHWGSPRSVGAIRGN